MCHPHIGSVDKDNENPNFLTTSLEFMAQVAAAATATEVIVCSTACRSLHGDASKDKVILNVTAAAVSRSPSATGHGTRHDGTGFVFLHLNPSYSLTFLYRGSNNLCLRITNDGC